MTRKSSSKMGYDKLVGGPGGSWSAERFLKLDWSAERKRKNRSERGAPIFFRISQYFPDFAKFSRSISKKKKKKKERWRPAGALSADRKCVGARSASAKIGRSVERK